MNQRNIILFSSLCLGICAQAQTLSFNIQLPDTVESREMRVFVSPLSAPAGSVTGLNRADDSSSFTGETGIDPSGIYYIYCNSSTAQAAIPVYVPAGEKTVGTTFAVSGFHPSTAFTDSNNRALKAFNDVSIDNSILIGRNATELTPGQFLAAFRSYSTKADSIIAADQPVQAVADFIRTQAYISANDTYTLAQFLNRNAGRDIGVHPDDFLPAPAGILDTPMASAFPSASTIIISSLKGNTTEEKIENLLATYKSEPIRRKATESLVSSFVDKFNYRENFEEGEKRLEAMTAKYYLPDKYLSSFRGRRATIPGTPFPDVRITDRDGNTIDFSRFKGKYVYIDLWASWCAPCCKEVPYLKKLEKDLEGGNVVFVSISIDTASDRWLKKMEQLDMHGNQFIDADGQLASKLNIRGIPHFMLYGPDGNLVSYSMSRPSDPATRQALEQYR